MRSVFRYRVVVVVAIIVEAVFFKLLASNHFLRSDQNHFRQPNRCIEMMKNVLFARSIFNYNCLVLQCEKYCNGVDSFNFLAITCDSICGWRRLNMAISVQFPLLISAKMSKSLVKTREHHTLTHKNDNTTNPKEWNKLCETLYVISRYFWGGCLFHRFASSAKFSQQTCRWRGCGAEVSMKFPFIMWFIRQLIV